MYHYFCCYHPQKKTGVKKRINHLLKVRYLNMDEGKDQNTAQSWSAATYLVLDPTHTWLYLLHWNIFSNSEYSIQVNVWSMPHLLILLQSQIWFWFLCDILYDMDCWVCDISSLKTFMKHLVQLLWMNHGHADDEDIISIQFSVRTSNN